MSKKILLVGFALICLVLSAGSAFATSIVSSKHDFSTSGSGTLVPSFFGGNFQVNSVTITEVCVFCHTPHGASTENNYKVDGQNAYLWNRALPATTIFQPYTSATFTAMTNSVTGVSLMCLSCHDGVTSIAVATLLNAPGTGNPAVTAISAMGDQIGDIYYPSSPFGDGSWGANIGELTSPGTGNLSNDHPVSFAWPAGRLLPSDQELQKRLGPSTNRRMECSTCHNVHDSAIPPFLAVTNDGSYMCRQCHSSK